MNYTDCPKMLLYSFFLFFFSDDFAVDEVLGTLMIASPLDRESVSVYTLSIGVRDQGPQPFEDNVRMYTSP